MGLSILKRESKCGRKNFIFSISEYFSKRTYLKNLVDHILIGWLLAICDSSSDKVVIEQEVVFGIFIDLETCKLLVIKLFWNNSTISRLRYSSCYSINNRNFQDAIIWIINWMVPQLIVAKILALWKYFRTSVPG